MTQSLQWNIDNSRLRVILDFNEIAVKIGMRFLLVGAVARDLNDSSIGVATSRITNDIDLAVYISRWKDFEEISAMLTDSNKFRRDKLPKHRFLHIATGIPIDIIPFGPIDGENHVINWPSPDHTIMSTLGFDEAYHNSIEVRIATGPDSTIRVCSRAGLVTLKLIAWNDNRPGHVKDALDLLHIIRYYLDPANESRLYEEHSDIMEMPDFDYECAGARLLGRDIGSISSLKTRSVIENILSSQISHDSNFGLASDMMGNISENEYQFGQILGLLKCLFSGIRDQS